MWVWFGLLAGCLIFGASVVVAMVLPRLGSVASLTLGLIALVWAAADMGLVDQRYASPSALIVAMLMLVAGTSAGFLVAASALPHLAPSRKAFVPGPIGASEPPSGDWASCCGIVLLGCSEPERYSPRVLAAHHNLLAETAEIHVPPTALPFIFLAEKARYRAAGRTLPGPAIARQIARRLEDDHTCGNWSVELAWCHTANSLAEAVDALHDQGLSRVAVIPLGAPDSAELDEARRGLEAFHHVNSTPVAFGPSIWADRLLPERLTERILAASGGREPGQLGVLLVAEGVPLLWGHRYPSAGEAENYFCQRTKVLLAEAGLSDAHVRVGWIEWMTPDVTESVRHIAALGCSRIVVAPTTIALPTLGTTLDLNHAITSARLPGDVEVVTLGPWGDDDALLDAIIRSANEAVGACDELES